MIFAGTALQFEKIGPFFFQFSSIHVHPCHQQQREPLNSFSAYKIYTLKYQNWAIICGI